MSGALLVLLSLAAAAMEPQAEDPEAGLAELQTVYQQSCANRAYGSYNDMCADMQRQIRAYQRRIRAELRPASPPAKPTTETPALPPTPTDGPAKLTGMPVKPER